VLVPVLNLISNKDSKVNIISKLLDKPAGIFVFSIPVILEGHLFNNSRLCFIRKHQSWFCFRIYMVFYWVLFLFLRVIASGIQIKEIGKYIYL
jgi:hypothetical protein